ncbi:MAG: ATP-binding cassette domain-containing protein [Planctomycetes bacterium]|nr:ATP-binding cassette domain-containing protein [Planctomycetota bacterium]
MQARARAIGFELRAAGLAFPGTVALSGVDLVVDPGEILALIGPSGAGKTSLLGLLNGRLVPTSGAVLVDGRDLATLGARELRALRTRLGHVPQHFGLVPNLRVLHNVLAGRLGRQGLFASLKTMAAPSRAELEEVHALLERLGIADKLYERVDALSGGQQQRVAVARALYQEPGALLADEPLASLDPGRARETLELLVDLARERGLTLILSLHDLELARALVPRLVALRAGRLCFDRPSGETDARELETLYRVDAAPLETSV